jgi:hypothetical protein
MPNCALVLLNISSGLSVSSIVIYLILISLGKFITESNEHGEEFSLSESAPLFPSIGTTHHHSSLLHPNLFSV